MRLNNPIITEALESARRNLTKLEFMAMDISNSNVESCLTDRVVAISQIAKNTVADYRTFEG